MVSYIRWYNVPKGVSPLIYLHEDYKIIKDEEGNFIWKDRNGTTIYNWEGIAKYEKYGVDYEFFYNTDAFSIKQVQESILENKYVDLTTLKDGDEVVCVNVPNQQGQFVYKFEQFKTYKIRYGKTGPSRSKLFIADSDDKGFNQETEAFKNCFVRVEDFGKKQEEVKPKVKRKIVKLKLNNIRVELHHVDETIFRKLLEL